MAEENRKSQGSRTGARVNVREACGKSFAPKSRGERAAAQRALTEPQKLLARITGFSMEYAIDTASLEGKFPLMPHRYKVDLADPISMTAIEVDGNSPRMQKRRFFDVRKTEILEALGWRTIRFKYADVMDHPAAVVAEVMAFIATKERAPELQRYFTFE